MRMSLRLILVTCALALSGCTRTIETRISSAGQSNPEKLGFILAPIDKTASAELVAARDLVVAKLTSKGLSPGDTGPYYLEVGVSSRPASIAVLEASKVLAAANPKRSTRKCQFQEYRLSLALTRIADGTEIYRASAGEFHCKAALGDTLQPLVDHALADLGNPRGEYAVKAKVE